MVVTRNRKTHTAKQPLKRSQRNYEQQKYWNDRYAAKLIGETIDDDDDGDDDHTDEWYYSYSDIADVLQSHLKKHHRHSPVLDIGCGLSKIFDELLNDHFLGPFVGIDYAPIVIKQCKKASRNNNIHYLILNMLQKRKPDLSFDSFGLIVDKGTTDGILNNEGSLLGISTMYEHASSFLSSNGIFLIITIKTVHDTEWFEDCLIPSLIRGSQNQQTKFIIHFHECATYTDGTENGPNIFVIVKYDCKSYSLRSSTNQSKQDISQIVTVKCY
ncbi:unnamed protein product [Rotaria magnacalcarata]|uniref:Methyltransferase domain-containing protein n=3 Tax=Rotaria magnacalcarata TaxID=392030 RepID=A0A816HD77_9BILA|nr:unnamed protein product [Rotaria magnacalcarata]CAF2176859.1 unnamed protein product [Rotaria magnacalcarata]CAF4822707.1 unnamed protein product [Rotaria magnacalcarata]